MYYTVYNHYIILFTCKVLLLHLLIHSSSEYGRAEGLFVLLDLLPHIISRNEEHGSIFSSFLCSFLFTLQVHKPENKTLFKVHRPTEFGDSLITMFALHKNQSSSLPLGFKWFAGNY